MLATDKVRKNQMYQYSKSMAASLLLGVESRHEADRTAEDSTFTGEPQCEGDYIFLFQ